MNCQCRPLALQRGEKELDLERERQGAERRRELGMWCLEGEGQDQEQQKELSRTAAHPDGLQSAAFRACLSSSPVAGACGLISPHPCS